MSDDLIERAMKEISAFIEREDLLPMPSNDALEEHPLIHANALLFGALVGRRERAEKAEAEVARLREALAFYADGWEGHAGDSGLGGNYPADPDCWPGEALQEDCGQRARRALKDKSNG